ncbi:MAG: hypothetical protein ACE3L7_17655 [Candidatus Pristimantibacillus sp.]
MNKKPKLYSSVAGLIILLLLSGIGTIAQENMHPFHTEFEPDVITINDLKLLDSRTGNILHLGMTKKEITALYGKEDEINMFGNYEYGGLQVFYRDDVAVKFDILAGGNLTNRFKTYRGIGLGDAKEDITMKYGEKFADISPLYGSVLTAYVIKNKGDTFETRPSDDPQWSMDWENVYVIAFSSEQKVTMFSMGDSQSVMNLK